MGGGTIFRFYGGHSCYEGGHRAHGGSPSLPTRENPARSNLVSELHTFFFFYKKLRSGPSTECFLAFGDLEYLKFLNSFLTFS